MTLTTYSLTHHFRKATIPGKYFSSQVKVKYAMTITKVHLNPVISLETPLGQEKSVRITRRSYKLGVSILYKENLCCVTKSTVRNTKGAFFWGCSGYSYSG